MTLVIYPAPPGAFGLLVPDRTHVYLKKNKTQKYTPVKKHILAHLAPKKMLLDRSLVADILAV